MNLKFDEKGLIPAIVQDHYTKEVLTLAYMNAETLALTIAEGRTVFWSRSRQEIWRKGETSGNVQRVVSITADCDADALVVEVVKSGPACHTGAESCFFNEVYVSPELKQFSWQGLYQLIKGRKDSPKEGSYTTYLFEKGKEKILKKVGEECTEVIIAGEKEDKEETVYEISDLAYHVLVLMVSAGITVEDVTRELEKRHLPEAILLIMDGISLDSILYLIGNILLCLLGIYQLKFRSREMRYLPTKSVVKEKNYSFNLKYLEPLKEMIESGNFSNNINIEKGTGGNLRLDVLMSADKKFAAVRLLQFIPYSYIPVMDMQYLRNDKIAALENFLEHSK